MQNSYQLKFTPIANDDLDGIYRYISEHLVAPKAANDLMDNIETSIMQLKGFPYSGSPVADDILSSRGYRKLIVKNYIVFYLIDETEKQVVIMRVLYGTQQCENLL
ncbi:translation repressor RelE [Peptococcaceae bacterium SCADC1_2_3]|jgi:addiction module RelE/StbE family toxin|nr:translation repressor RelE [Peptococcaceae bacterium SCADC1_2_3]KFI37092.1 translation repressor RelE [Peptococcaceae bacterium SCADC1_2_3]HBQ28424.1 type II toxin-antitoxin system mRNA interferase toxin, RelE/StbE family [Desulfotomaculum sp.]